MNEWLIGAVALALAGLGVALGVWALPELARKRQGYPLEAQVEAALVPLLFTGICAAYRLTQWGMEEFRQVMSGADRKKIADALYKLLPERVGQFDLALVKRVVPEARFCRLVQDTFDRFDAHFLQFSDHYDRLFWDWAERFKGAWPAGETTTTPPVVYGPGEEEA